jgi:uncharacterized YigZ family protein
MFDDTYKTIEIESEGIYKDKGSKFIAITFPVKNEEEIKIHLQSLRKKYYDARHHCYAYALGPTRDSYRTNDDGEPSGTAGKPIFGQILSYEVTNILIVVVRYFGGIKLGVRGLINAYKAAAADAIQNNRIIVKQILEIYELQFEYPLMNDVMKILKDQNLEQISNNFGINCQILFAVRKNDSEIVKKIFSNLYGLKISYKHTV